MSLIIWSVMASLMFSSIAFILSLDPSNYFLYSQIAMVLSMLMIAVTFILVFILKPVLPFLKAKLSNGMIMFITEINDNIKMIVPNKRTITLDAGKEYGTFLGNPHAAKRFGGVNTYQIYEENAVPPETELVSICSRLQEMNIDNYSVFSENPDTILKNDGMKVILKDLDLKSVTRYFDYINPHYVNVRIENAIAEVLKDNRESWKALLPWITMMGVLLIFGAVAYAIVQSGAVQNVASSVTGGTVIP